MIRGLLVIAVCLGAFTRPAEARRRAFVQTGDDIKHVASLDEAKQKEAKEAFALENPSIGYKYKRFGIFWLDIWRWGGEFAIYEGDKYAPISEKVARELTGKEVSRPLTYHFPPGLVGILLTIVVIITMLIVGRDVDEDAPTDAEW